MDKLHGTLKLAFTFLVCSFLTTSSFAAYRLSSVLKPSFDIGVMLGYTGGNRKGVMVEPVTGASANNSGSQDSFEVGGQMRLLFGSEFNYRPFIYVNGSRPIGTPLSIVLGKFLPPFTNGSKLVLKNNWLSRVGLAAATPWLYETFQLGIGAGALIINQTLQTYVGQATTSIYNQNKTSVRPTFMGSVTWSLCPCCLRGNEALLTAQINADSDPVINATVPSTVGNLNTRIHQAWVPRGDLIFSISFS